MITADTSLGLWLKAKQPSKAMKSCRKIVMRLAVAWKYSLWSRKDVIAGNITPVVILALGSKGNLKTTITHKKRRESRGVFLFFRFIISPIGKFPRLPIVCLSSPAVKL